jgi:hypothetical protein
LVVKYDLEAAEELEKINKIYQLVKIDGYTLDGAKKALKSKELKPQQEETNQMELVILNLERIKVKLLHLKK